jgi:hypothetical protein
MLLRYIPVAGFSAIVLTVLLAKPPTRYAAMLPLTALAESSDSDVVRVGAEHTLVTSVDGRITFARSNFRDGPFVAVRGAELHGEAPELHPVDGRWLCVFTDADRVIMALGASTAGPFTPIVTDLVGREPTVVRDRSSGQLSLIYVADGVRMRSFAIKDARVAWTTPATLLTRTGRAPSVIEGMDASWLLLTTDRGIVIGKLGRDRLETTTALLTATSPSLQGGWLSPGNVAMLQESDEIYSMYFHAVPRAGGKRALLRVTLSFVDGEGKASDPFIVEDVLAANAT